MVEAVHSRLDLARQQLGTAIDLLLDQNNYTAAITLAGAAEEIFGKALRTSGQKAAVEESFESMSDLLREIDGTELSKKEFISKENAARKCAQAPSRERWTNGNNRP